jgi:hypothetical protein
MRVSTLSKVGILAGLALCTFVVTSTIVGQTAANRKKATARQTTTRNRAVEPGAQPGLVDTVVTPKSAPFEGPAAGGLDGRLDARNDAIHPNLTSQGSLDLMNAAAAGGKVNIAVKVTLYETSPAYSYLWSLRVYDGSENPKLLSEYYYRDQIFDFPLREKFHPTFSESIDLQPGTYTVQVFLHRIKKGFDLARLADENVRRPTVYLSPMSKVRIAN